MEFCDKNGRTRSLTIATDGTPSLDGVPLLIESFCESAANCGMNVVEFTDVLEELGNIYFGGNTRRPRKMIEGFWNWLDRAEWTCDTDYVEDNEDYEEDDNDEEDNDYDDDVREDEAYIHEYKGCGGLIDMRFFDRFDYPHTLAATTNGTLILDGKELTAENFLVLTAICGIDVPRLFEWIETLRNTFRGKRMYARLSDEIETIYDAWHEILEQNKA